MRCNAPPPPPLDARDLPLRLCGKAGAELETASAAVGSAAGAVALTESAAETAGAASASASASASVAASAASAASAAVLAASLRVSSRARRGGGAARELSAERRWRISCEM